MTIHSKQYTDDDLPQLQSALAHWIHTGGDLGYCHIGDIPHRIYNVIQGRLPLHEVVHVWYMGTAIIGMVIAQVHHGVFDVFVSPSVKGSEVEQDMLQQGYNIMRQHLNKIGRDERPVTIETHGNDTKRIQSLLAVGFERDSHSQNMTELSLDDAISEPTLPDSFSIRGSTMADAAQLAAVHSGAFGSNWTPERYRDEVMLKPGYIPEREVVVVAPDGRFAAFTKTWLDDLNKVGLFEPVGVHSDYQRRGLGRALMLHCLHEMKRLGMKTAMVGHELDNPASTGLYHSLGFRTKHEIIGYKKA